MSSRPIGAVFVAGLLVLGGCSGAVPGLGDDGLAFVADPIEVGEGAVAAGGYDVASDGQVSFDREVGIGDRRQRVTVTAHVIHLRRSYRGASLAHVVVLSLPRVSVLGQRVDLVERIGRRPS